MTIIIHIKTTIGTRMKASLRLKTIALYGIAFLTFSGSAAHAITLYDLFDQVGWMTDWLLTRGSLNEKYTQMFNEITKKLEIDNRHIKAKNSGLLLRWWFGYNNALAVQFTNRVYFNEDVLNELPDEQKKFLMAHELVHHREHHIFKRIAVNEGINLVKKIITYAHQLPGRDENYLNQYLTRGFSLPFQEEFSVYSLLKAQIAQKQETEADTKAITIAGIRPQDGIDLFQNLYYPDTTKWPLYFKIQDKMQRLSDIICSLPILKEHTPHLASFKDRIEHLIKIELSISNI